VATLAFNLPAKGNAISIAMLGELQQAVTEINRDRSLRAVVLTGAGKHFSTGADISEMDVDDFSVERMLVDQYKPILLGIYQSRKPWISAVNGAAAGVGSAYAMTCDLMVMAEDAYIYQAFAAIGLVPDGGATWHLARTLGRKRAFEVMVTAGKIKAQDCLELGLCNRVVPAGEVLANAQAWAAELASKAPLAMTYAKQSLADAMEAHLADVISTEARLQHICITSEDAAEGRDAFLQKRAPVWKGR